MQTGSGLCILQLGGDGCAVREAPARVCVMKVDLFQQRAVQKIWPHVATRLVGSREFRYSVEN